MRHGQVVLLSSSLLALVLAAPAVLRPTQRLAGNEIVGRHQDAYTMVRIFENPRLGHFTQPATDGPGAFVARFTGGVAAYNAIVLATFPLAALFTYLLARRLDCAPAAAGLAGLAFAFSPLHVAHIAYHPHIAQVQWIPLWFLALWCCLDRFTVARAAGLVAATALLTLSNFYSGFFAAVLTPFAAGLYWWAAPRRRRGFDLAATAATLAATALAGLAYVAATAPQVLRDTGSVAFAREDLFRYAAWPVAYVLPAVEHPLLGGWARAVWAGREIADGLIEQQVGIGWILPLLALAALGARAAGRRETAGLRAAPALAGIGAVAFVASLPPELAVGGLTLRLPSGALYAVAPMFRAYARFAFFFHLMVILLAAVALTTFARHGRRGRRATFGLAALIALELAPVPPLRGHDVLPTRAHRWLADRIEQDAEAAAGRTLDCVPEDLRAERNVPYLFPGPLVRLGRTVGDCREPALAAKLAALEIERVIMRLDDPAGRKVANAPPDGLAPLERFADSALLQVTASPAEVWVGELEGFSWREPVDELDSYRWMGAHGVIHLHTTGRVERRGWLAVRLMAFPGERQVEVSIEGRPLGVLTVAAQPAWREIGPFELATGAARLELRPTAPPVRGDDVLGNGDLRPVTVALWDWRWRERE